MARNLRKIPKPIGVRVDRRDMTTLENKTIEEAALALMETALRDGRPLASEYPLVFGEAAAGHVETIEDEGRVVSTCAWIARTLLTGAAELPAALVGSVATEEAARGKGLGTKVLDQATKRAASEGAALSLLWADDPNWYQERGWVPFGTEAIYVIDDTIGFLLPEPTGVRPMRDGEAAAIHGLYAQRAIRVDRTNDETEAMLGVPGMETFVCERDGEIVGYACMGRGEDLGQVIHEWAGAPDAVLPIVSRLWSNHREDVERLFMMVPPSEADFTAFFEFVKARGANGILAMAKLGDTEAMAEVFDATTPADVTAKAASENAIDVTGPSGTLRLTDHEILLALCPPRGDRRVTDVLESEIGATLPNLPIKPFVWGLDSI